MNFIQASARIRIQTNRNFRFITVLFLTLFASQIKISLKRKIGFIQKIFIYNE